MTMAVTLRYFTEFGKPALQKTIYERVYCILARVQCRSNKLFSALGVFEVAGATTGSVSAVDMIS